MHGARGAMTAMAARVEEPMGNETEATMGRVLVVSSEGAVRVRASDILRNGGHEVLVARDPGGGAVVAHGRSVDLVLLDGGALKRGAVAGSIRDLAEATAKVPVIVCGEHDTEEARSVAVHEGAIDYVHRDCHPQELLARVRLTLASAGRGAGLARGMRELQADALQTVKGLSAERRVQSRASLDVTTPWIDGNTGLAQTSTLFQEVKAIVARTGEMAIHYVRCSQNGLLEETLGWEVVSGVLRATGRAISEALPEAIGEHGAFAVAYAGGDDFIVFASVGSGSDEGREPRDASLLSERIAGRVAQQYGATVAQLFEVTVGSSCVRLDARIHTERLVMRGIWSARTMAEERLRWGHERKVALLKRCLREEALHLLFQPIVRAQDGSLMGYEALSRGGVPGLENPQILFDVAEGVGMVWDISREVRRLGRSHLGAMPVGALMFVNLHPVDFGDPQLLRELELHAAGGGSVASRLVYEITERAAIDDYARLRAAIAPLREMGVRIAVDDLGSGFAGLNSIAYVEPDFIKFDMALIRDVDRHPLRQNLIRTFVKFAETIPSQVIAEGVETESERACLVDLGCHFLQGYYFARPGPPFPSIERRP